MTIYHSEPYKEVCRRDPTTFPVVVNVLPYSDSNRACNDKPHEVYCEKCQYRITVQGLAGPRCGACKSYLITIVRRNELAQSINVSTSGT